MSKFEFNGTLSQAAQDDWLRAAHESLLPGLIKGLGNVRSRIDAVQPDGERDRRHATVELLDMNDAGRNRCAFRNQRLQGIAYGRDQFSLDPMTSTEIYSWNRLRRTSP